MKGRKSLTFLNRRRNEVTYGCPCVRKEPDITSIVKEYEKLWNKDHSPNDISLKEVTMVLAKKKKTSSRKPNGLQSWLKKRQRAFKKIFKGKRKKRKRYITKKQRAQRRKQLWLCCIAALGLMLFFLLQENRGTPASNEAVSEEPVVVHSEEEFVNLIGQYAVAEYPNSQVLPSIVTAQAVLESDFGQSQLSSDYFNLFGRKSYSANEPSVDLPTLEFVDGQYITVNEPFRVYQSWEESVADHGRLLANGTSWNDAHYDRVVDADTYQVAAYALQEAGYATDPNYAESLISVIERFELTRFDDQVQ